MITAPFEDSSGLRVKLDSGAMSGMLEHVQHRLEDFEAGGVLLGRVLSSTGDIIVDAVTVPMEGDSRSPTSFFRSASAHQRCILDAWNRSQGTCGYLGEWHTHPEPCPTPSVIDWKGWRRRLVEDLVDARFSLFLIMGTQALGAWIGDRRTQNLRMLGYRGFFED